MPIHVQREEKVMINTTLLLRLLCILLLVSCAHQPSNQGKLPGSSPPIDAAQALKNRLPHAISEKDINAYKQLLDRDFRYIDIDTLGHPFVVADFENEIKIMEDLFAFSTVDFTLDILDHSQQLASEDILADEKGTITHTDEKWQVYRTRTQLSYQTATGDTFKLNPVMMIYKLRIAEDGTWKIIRIRVAGSD